MYKQRSKRQVARIIKKNVENAVKLAELDSISEFHNHPVFKNNIEVHKVEHSPASTGSVIDAGNCNYFIC